MSKKLLAVTFSAACITLAVVACNTEGPTVPPKTETIERAPEPVVSATPTPAPAATPTPAPTTKKAWDVSCAAGGSMTVYYNGEASRAEVLTYYTSFDGPTPFGKQTDIVDTGKTVSRVFPACSQGDAEPTVGLPAGHCYFDKDGNPFSDPRSPKVTECRNQCVPRWDVLEEVRIITDWTEYTPAVNALTQESKCYKYERQLVIKRERNSCTKEERDSGEPYYEYRQTEIQCPCVLNPSYSQNVTRSNYSNGTPYQYFYDGGSGIENDCHGEGGTFFSSLDGRNNVCRTSVNHGEWWEYDNNDYANRYKTTGSDKDGIVLVGSVTGDDATWRFKLTCGQTTKDDESFTRTCEQGSKTLPAETTGGIQIGDGQFGYISSTDHEDSTCYLEVFKNGSVVQTVTYLPIN